MAAELDLDVLAEVQDALQLPHLALVEKDYYVVKALSALAAFTSGHTRLVFGGGTALCRAHRLIQRMSEDIDLKIVPETPMTVGERRAFRERVKEALEAVGFKVSVQSHDSYRTHVFELEYTSVAPSVDSLRPNVKVELSMWPTYLPSVDCSIGSFVAQAYDREPEIPSFPCADVLETAAEKFVALTRRIGEERALGDRRDPTLMRHIYDLHKISAGRDIDPLVGLIRSIIPSDQKRSGAGRYPAYAEDPTGAIKDALEALRADPEYAIAFGVFQRDMVYGERAEYGVCLDALDRIWALVGNGARNSATPDATTAA